MAKALNVSLAVTADTLQAAAALQKLKQQITLLQTTSTNFSIGGSWKQDAAEISKTMATLLATLKNATNMQTGNLDLTKFTLSMLLSNMSLEKYLLTLNSLGPAGQLAFASLTNSIVLAEVPLRNANGLLSQFATTLANTARWQISSSILHSFVGSISLAFHYALDLNESLNRIQIVTLLSDSQIAKFAESANKAAKALSTTTTAYTDAALIYYQLGLSSKEVEERTNVTIKMANAAGVSAKTVSDQMTAVWNNFADGTKNLEYYADVMTALGAATASSTDEIATGLLKFASVADAVGLSYENAASALATITATTRQSADSVGTGLRTLFARLLSLKLGETLEDGVDLTKYTKALLTVGVSALDATGELRSMDDILTDLGDKWENLSNTLKVALAQTVGGVRQYTTLMALMENNDFFKRNLLVALGSEGTVQKLQEIYAQSWEAALKRVKASAQTIFSDLINDDFFTQLNDGFAGFLDLIHETIDAMGGLQGIFLAIGTAATTIFSKQVATGLLNMVNNIKMILPGGLLSILNLRQEAINLLAKGLSNSIVGKEMAIAYLELSKLLGTYIDNALRMSAFLKDIANSMMLLQLALILNVELSAKEVQNTEKQAINSRIVANRYTNQNDIFNLSYNKLLSVGDYLRGQFSELEKVSELEGRILSFVEHFGLQKIDTTSLEEVNQAMQKMTITASDLDKYFGEEGKNNSIGTLLQNALNSKDIQQVVPVLNKIYTDLYEAGKGQGGSLNILDNINTSLEKLKNNASPEDLKKIEEIIKLTNEIKNKGTEKGVADFNLFGSQLNLNKTTIELQKAMQDIANGNYTAMDGFVSLAGTLTSLGYTILRVSNLWKTLNDTLASGSLKTIALLTTLGPALNTIKGALNVNTLKALGAIGTSLLPLDAAAKTAATSVTTLGGAITTLGPLIAIGVALIGMLVGAIGLIVTLSLNAKRALELIKTAATNFTSDLNDLLSTANELKNEFTNYNEIYNLLLNCALGSSEWKENMSLLVELTNELLDTYPILLKYKNLLEPNAQGNLIWSQETIDKTIMPEIRDTIRSSTFLTGIANASVIRLSLLENASLESDFYQVSAELDTIDELLGKIQEKLSAYKNGQFYYDNYISDWLEETLDLDELNKRIENLIFDKDKGNFKEVLKEFIIPYLYNTEELKNFKDTANQLLYDFYNSMYSPVLSYLQESDLFKNLPKSLIRETVNGATDKIWSIVSENIDLDEIKVNEHDALSYFRRYVGVAGGTQISDIEEKNGKYSYTDQEGTVHSVTELQLLYVKAVNSMSEGFESIDAWVESILLDYLQFAETTIPEIINNKEVTAKNGRHYKLTSDTTSALTRAFLSYYLTGDLNEISFNDLDILSQYLKYFTDQEIIDLGISPDKIKQNVNLYNTNNRDTLLSYGLDTSRILYGQGTALLTKGNELSKGPLGNELTNLYFSVIKDIMDLTSNLSKEVLNDILNKLLNTKADSFKDTAESLLSALKINTDFLSNGNYTEEFWNNWVSLIESLEGKIPVFSNLKNLLLDCADIVLNLDFGSTIKDEDYLKLIAYESEWESFFLLQADGKYKVIASNKEILQLLASSLITLSKLIRDISKLQKDIFKEDKGYIYNVKESKEIEKIQKLLLNETLLNFLSTYGYNKDLLTNFTGTQEWTDHLLKIINALSNEDYDSLIENLGPQILSLASSFEQLNQLYNNYKTTVDEETGVETELISSDDYKKQFEIIAKGNIQAASSYADFTAAIEKNKKTAEEAGITNLDTSQLELEKLLELTAGYKNLYDIRKQYFELVNTKNKTADLEQELQDAEKILKFGLFLKEAQSGISDWYNVTAEDSASLTTLIRAVVSGNGNEVQILNNVAKAFNDLGYSALYNGLTTVELILNIIESLGNGDLDNSLTKLQNAALALQGLEFGKTINELTYKDIIDNTEGIKDYFIALVDGTYKYIGNSKKIREATRANLKARQDELKARQDVLKKLLDKDKNANDIDASFLKEGVLGEELNTILDALNITLQELYSLPEEEINNKIASFLGINFGDLITSSEESIVSLLSTYKELNDYYSNKSFDKAYDKQWLNITKTNYAAADSLEELYMATLDAKRHGLVSLDETTLIDVAEAYVNALYHLAEAYDFTTGKRLLFYEATHDKNGDFTEMDNSLKDQLELLVLIGELSEGKSTSALFSSVGLGLLSIIQDFNNIDYGDIEKLLLVFDESFGEGFISVTPEIVDLLKQIEEQTPKSTKVLDELLQKLSEITSLISKLDFGDIVSDEELERIKKLVELLGTDEANAFLGSFIAIAGIGNKYIGSDLLAGQVASLATGKTLTQGLSYITSRTTLKALLEGFLGGTTGNYSVGLRGVATPDAILDYMRSLNGVENKELRENFLNSLGYSSLNDIRKVLYRQDEYGDIDFEKLELLEKANEYLNNVKLNPEDFNTLSNAGLDVVTPLRILLYLDALSSGENGELQVKDFLGEIGLGDYSLQDLQGYLNPSNWKTDENGDYVIDAVVTQVLNAIFDLLNFDEKLALDKLNLLTLGEYKSFEGLLQFLNTGIKNKDGSISILDKETGETITYTAELIKVAMQSIGGDVMTTTDSLVELLNAFVLGALDTDTYRENLVRLAGLYSNTKDELEEYNELLNEYNEASAEEQLQLLGQLELTQTALEEAILIGEVGKEHEITDLDGLEEYTRYLQDAVDHTISFKDALLLAAEEMERDSAVKNLSSNLDSILKTLRNTDEAVKNTKKFEKAEDDLKESLEDILDLDLDKVSDELLEWAKQGDNLKKVINGDKKAWEEMLKVNTKGLLKDVKNMKSLVEKLTDLAGEFADYNIGDAIDSDQVEEVLKLIDLIGDSEGWDAATRNEKANQIMNSVGEYWQDVLQEAPVITLDIEADTTGAATTMEELVAQYESQQITSEYFIEQANKIIEGDPIKVNGHVDIKGLALVAGGQLIQGETAEITGGYDSNGDMPTFKTERIDGGLNNATSKGRPSGGGGGGGGGGGKLKKKDYKKPDVSKRYHTIREHKADNDRNKLAANREKERAFGAERIKLSENEIKLLKESVDLLRQYIEEINGYLQGDKNEMINAVSKLNIGIDFLFDENGVIENYREIETALLAQENALIDKYNRGSIDDEAYEEALKKIDEAREYIGIYEETLNLYEEQMDEMALMLNELSDMALELTKLKVELKIEVNDDTLKLLEYRLARIEDNAYKTAEAISLIGDKTGTTIDKIKNWEQGLNDLFEGHGLDINDINNWTDLQLIEAGFTQNEIDWVRELRDNMIDAALEIVKARQEMLDILTNNYDTLYERVTTLYDLFDHYNTILDNYKNITDLMGRTMNKDLRNLIQNLNRNILANQRNLMAAAKATYEELLKQLEAAQKHYNDVIATGDKEAILLWEAVLNNINEKVTEAHENWLSSWNDAVQTARNNFEYMLEGIIESFNETMAGAFGNLDYLSDAFERKLETDELYLLDYDRLYELSKLQRDLNKTLSDTRGLENRKALLALQKEITELQASGVRLSQYDVDALRKRYELEQAYADLLDSQDAKHTVRLLRNNEGLWGYVYTVDEDAVAEAEQNYEDKLHEYLQLNDEYITELQSRVLETQQTYRDTLEEIMTDTTLTDELREARINELNDWLLAEMYFFELQLNNAMNNLHDTLTRYYNAYEDTRALLIDSWTETNLSLLTNISSMLDYMTNWSNATEELLSSALQALHDSNEEIAGINEESGVESEDYAGTIAEVSELITTSSEEIEAAVALLAEELNEEFLKALDMAIAKEEEWSSAISSTADRVDSLAESLNTLIDRLTTLESFDVGLVNARAKYQAALNSWRLGTISEADWHKAEQEWHDYLDNWMAKFDEGGYTGAWGPGGKMAILHERENVFNKDDTLKLLDAAKILRIIDLLSSSMIGGIGALNAPTTTGFVLTLEQLVTISAEFPNVTDHYEIEEAFNNLVNKATQYANEKRNG